MPLKIQYTLVVVTRSGVKQVIGPVESMKADIFSSSLKKQSHLLQLSSPLEWKPTSELFYHDTEGSFSISLLLIVIQWKRCSNQYKLLKIEVKSISALLFNMKLIRMKNELFKDTILDFTMSVNNLSHTPCIFENTWVCVQVYMHIYSIFYIRIRISSLSFWALCPVKRHALK